MNQQLSFLRSWSRRIADSICFDKGKEAKKASDSICFIKEREASQPLDQKKKFALRPLQRTCTKKGFGDQGDPSSLGLG